MAEGRFEVGFRNANRLVKEDDPLIATTFAVQMMTRAGS